MKYYGTVEIKSNFKKLFEYACVEAASLEEAHAKAKEECMRRHFKKIEIISVKMTEMKGD